ncbi:hypothetical protein LPJ53_002114 [Coemansia erecta]|uniref:CAP-Gly domain-containing protein n=1 Tax=Coemansia erecta TaxID=147472 RepID=A0A9W7Y2L9_9FUNG|nr:hypothetical protein LPJ53_002114 [Coemansia erecta]
MSIVTLFVESQNASSERRFPKSLQLDELKARLEPIVGIAASSQHLTLLRQSQEVCALTDATKMLGYYPVEDYMTLLVTSLHPSAPSLNFTDDSQVEKYVMPDDDYDKMSNTVRAFKRRHNMGRFADAKSAMSIEEEEGKVDVKVGQRCMVGERRGAVRFVGQTKFKPGVWVGVEYDEPVGKNDGSVDGERYFECRADHGSFVKPDMVVVGDFPEEDLFASDLEEM